MIEQAKSVIKLALIITWIALWFLPVLVVIKLGKFHIRDRFVQLCNKGLLYIVGIRVHVTGKLADDRPLMLVTNHISYLDVPIIGAHANVRFTPKSEISKWPAIGLISQMTGSVFIDRRPGKVADMKQVIAAELTKGEVVCLFPESTTGNGLHMQAFKSGFFHLAEAPIDGKTVHIQPAAITYTHISRLPIDTTQWPFIAWYGDMELMPHLRELLKFGPIDVELIFLPPVTFSEHGDRKKLAAHCQEMIGEAIQSVRNKRLENPKTRRTAFHPRLLRTKSYK